MIRFPSKALIIPPLVPIAVMATIAILGWSGHTFNVHGDAIPAVAAFITSAFVAVFYEAYAVPRAWQLLQQEPTLRTPWNYAALGWGLLYLIAAATAAVWFIVTDNT